MIKLDGAIGILDQGGYIRFVWKTIQHDVITPEGEAYSLDGRSYQSIINNKALTRTEKGSTDDATLVIEWRLIKK